MTGTYTLVVLHGWGHNKDHWTALSDYFKHDEFVVFDLPGFGAEPLVSDTWGVPEYSAWARAKIEGLGKKNIVLLGHSFGGRIAGYIASENPAWLKGLILYGSPSLYRPGKKTTLKIAVAKLLRGLGFSKRSPGKMYQIFKKVVAFDQSKSLPHIQVPTLLLWGENDTEVPVAIAKEMNTLISKSQLTILESAGHNAHFDNPNLFYGTIRRFIGNL